MCGERVCVPPREKMARKREDEVIDVSEWSRVVDYERNENQESTKEKASIHCSRCTFDNLSSAVLCAVCSSPLYAHENATRMVDVLASSANNTMQDGLVAMIDAALQRQQQQTNFRNGKRQRGNLYNFRLCSNLTPHITQQGVLDGILSSNMPYFIIDYSICRSSLVMWISKHSNAVLCIAKVD